MTTPAQHRFFGILVVSLVLAISSAFLFARLGHYALWDDEANTALLGMSVWRTGDVNAIIGHNILAYNGGATLTGFRERYIPPLSYYLAGLSLGLLGDSKWASRLPFALCGLGCIALMLRWAWKERLEPPTWCLLALALTGNISLFLYCRQCRYYAIAILASLILAYMYRFHLGRGRWMLAFSLVSAALFATNYMNYAAIYACLAVDYLVWERKRRPLSLAEIGWLVLPQLAILAPIALIWNPLAKDVWDYRPDNWFLDKATLYWWFWRDLGRCEFGVIVLLMAAPAVALLTRHHWLMRASVAMVIYVSLVTVVSPEPVGRSYDSDIRYLSPMIPLCIAIGVMTLRRLGETLGFAMLPLAVLAFWTSLLFGGREWVGHHCSTIVDYIRELADPPGDSITMASRWINAYVPREATVFVEPEYMTYPLMYHSPQLIYAWQFRHPPDPQFRGLAPIHYLGLVPPDYVVLFGLDARERWRRIKLPEGVRYRPVGQVDHIWWQMHRPELMWRTFIPVEPFDRYQDSVLVLQKESSLSSDRPDAGGP